MSRQDALVMKITIATVLLTCLGAALIAWLTPTHRSVVEQTTDDGLVVTCVETRRGRAASLDCDWDNARPVDQGDQEGDR